MYIYSQTQIARKKLFILIKMETEKRKTLTRALCTSYNEAKIACNRHLHIQNSYILIVTDLSAVCNWTLCISKIISSNVTQLVHLSCREKDARSVEKKNDEKPENTMWHQVKQRWMLHTPYTTMLQILRDMENTTPTQTTNINKFILRIEWNSLFSFDSFAVEFFLF